jgi:hypothetical protein
MIAWVALRGAADALLDARQPKEWNWTLVELYAQRRRDVCPSMHLEAISVDDDGGFELEARIRLGGGELLVRGRFDRGGAPVVSVPLVVGWV